MTPDDCFELGYIVRTHGLKGALHIQFDADDPSAYNNMESIFVLKGENLIPFLVRSVHINGNKGVLELVDVNSIEDAQELKSCPLFLPLSLLPPLKDDQFYYHQVIGYKVIDDSEGPLGIIANIFSAGAQDIVSMIYKESEVLFPVTNDIIDRADHDKKLVYVKLPKGLLEIYLTK